MLRQDYSADITKTSLDMLLNYRRNEFQTLANKMNISETTPKWEEFILQYCLNVDEVFKIWIGKEDSSKSSPDHQTLTLLRMISKKQSTMIQVTNLLNLAYTMAQEFKEIYSRFR